MICTLIGDEATLSYRRRRDFGAFFEIIYYDSEVGFSYLREFSILFWLVDRKGARFALLPHAFKVMYRDSHIFIVRLSDFVDRSGVRIAKWESIRAIAFSIPPFLPTAQKVEVEMVFPRDLVSNNYYNYVLVPKDLNKEESPDRMLFGGALLEPMIEVSRGPYGESILSFTRAFREAFGQAVGKFLAETCCAEASGMPPS